MRHGVCVVCTACEHTTKLFKEPRRGSADVRCAPQPEPGLEALEICLQAGFDQFQKIRTDPNLEKLRQSPKFTPLIERFDEPVIDTNILK